MTIFRKKIWLKNTDFVNFGTYRAEEADILKHELEKRGISVKVIYPGTDIGRDVTAGASFPAYKLMIRAYDIPTAEKLKERFSIKCIEPGEEMPLPKTYTWGKRGLNRISLIGWLISFFGALITSYLSILKLFPENTPLYFMDALFIFFFLWLCSTVYNIFTE